MSGEKPQRDATLDTSLPDRAPAWLGQAITAATAPLYARIILLEQQVAAARNGHRILGQGVPYLEIPFLNGLLPSQNAPPLPALTNFEKIQRLTSSECCAFLEGWTGIPRNPEYTSHSQLLVDVRNTVGVNSD